MADLQLSEYLTFMRSELHLLGVDYAYRGGYTGDPENASNPDSISLTAKLNEAIAEIQTEFGFAKTEADIALADGTSLYNLPATIQTVESIHLNKIRLRSSTVQSMDRQKLNWRQEEGTPKIYMMRGADKILLYPEPNAVGTLKVYGLSTLTRLAGNTDSITEMPESYQYLFPIRACLNIASADTGNTQNADRIANLKAREEKLVKNLLLFIGEATEDENAPRVARGRAQGTSVGSE